MSDQLWGGAGSIADLAFESDQSQILQFQQLMIKLGRLQIEAGKANLRTEFWVRAFESCSGSDLSTESAPQPKAAVHFRMLQGIASAKGARFLIAALVLPGYLAVRVPTWWRRLRHRPFLALLILGFYVSIALHYYLKTQHGQLDRARWVT